MGKEEIIFGSVISHNMLIRNFLLPLAVSSVPLTLLGLWHNNFNLCVYPSHDYLLPEFLCVSKFFSHIGTLFIECSPTLIQYHLILI